MLKFRVINCPELMYISKTLLGEFIGVDFILELNKDDSINHIELENGKKIVFKDSFFSKYEYSERYLSDKSIPNKVKWLETDFFNESVPVIFGEPEIEVSGNEIVCYADFLSSAFFMLTRWEEAVSDSKDIYGRFPAKNSLACKEGFLNKPVVNQYAEIIWNMMVHLGYEGKRSEHKFKVDVSHDVDAPYKYAFMDFLRGLRMLGRSIFKKRLVSGLKDFMNFLSVKSGNIEADPYNTFDYIMDLSERMGLKSTFFFISQRTNKRYDGFYEISDQKIKDLIKKIGNRGHIIGLHGSYDSNVNRNLSNEYSGLIEICSSLDIKMPEISRQHFLRWETPQSFQDLEDAGIKYDATMTFADIPGFRTGSCYEHSIFNVKTRRHLNLIERPLILMECSLTAERYLNLSFDDALKKAVELKNECKKYGGTFSVLWHNNQFVSRNMRELYTKILTESCND